MAKTPIKKTIKKVVKKVAGVLSSEFVITINIENAEYVGRGATALEALQNVPAPTLDFISSGNVTITRGGKSRDMFFATMPMKRLLNPYNMEVLANDLAVGL